MEGGLLKDTIMFQRQYIALDEYGHEVITYKDAFPTRANVKWNNGDRIVSNDEIVYDPTRANVKWNNGDRIVSNDEIVYDNSLTFTVRKYTPAEDTMIILYKGKKYRIITINPELDVYDRKEIVA